MSTTLASAVAVAVAVSGMPDIQDLPLDADVIIDEAEYTHIMRRIGVAEGEPSVSAFNSSI
jgi:hypothetical protein